MILKYNKLRSRTKITLTSIFFICGIWILFFRSSLYIMVSLHKRFGHLCIKLSPILPVKLKNVISIEFPTLYWFTHSDALDISRHNKKSHVFLLRVIWSYSWAAYFVYPYFLRFPVSQNNKIRGTYCAPSKISDFHFILICYHLTQTKGKETRIGFTF